MHFLFTQLFFVKNPASPTEATFPSADELAALRAWYNGLSSTEVARRYLRFADAGVPSSRRAIGAIRRKLAFWASSRLRPDLAILFRHLDGERTQRAKAVLQAVEQLRNASVPTPLITDPVDKWFSPRISKTLFAFGLGTLADLAVRIPRRRLWWKAIPGLGKTSARKIESFFTLHGAVFERVRSLITITTRDLVPWESLCVPLDVNGSNGTFRSPRNTCSLDADNDYAAVQTWLSLQESAATHRSYRKESERLILWAVFERGRALSSLTVEDAIAYRAFLRRPQPEARWVGKARPRTAPDWKPFCGPLSERSTAYALSVLGALFRWLMEQGYLVANPFSGVKVRGAPNSVPLDINRVFSEGEWGLLRAIAEGLEWSHGWDEPASQRLRFLLDFSYATGLRASELVTVTLRDFRTDIHDDNWLHLVGKGKKAGKVALPPLARSALYQYLARRGIPTTPALWKPGTHLVGALGKEDMGGISDTRLRGIFSRFFKLAAGLVETDNPSLAEKLLKASPHWMRHTHATHALDSGAELTTVRDNLRHASISTTSIYLHGDDGKRARQMNAAFSRVRDS